MDDSERPDRTAHRLRLAALRGDGQRSLLLEPDAEARADLARALDLLGLRKLRFAVTLTPEGGADWRLHGRLGATAVQPCVATLAPVTTRIEAEVDRLYLADPPPLPEGDEVEIPEDEGVEPLPPVLDLWALMQEELALNLPLYPHAEGAEPVAETFAEPGAEPLGDEAAKPFAGLAGLRDKLTRDEE